MYVGRQGKKDHHSREGQEVRDQRHDGQKLDELQGAPRPLEIPAAMEDGETADAQSEDIALDEGRRQKHPGIEDGELWNQGQERRGGGYVCGAGPLRIADGKRQTRLQDEHDEQSPRHGGDVETGRHGRRSRGVRCQSLVRAEKSGTKN